MKTRIKACTFLFLPLVIFFFTADAQDFPYGGISPGDLGMTRYDRDTSASAVVLKEFGYAFINAETYRLNFKYHVRIKILNKKGLKQANIEIPLQRDGTMRYEKIEELKASSFNLENGQVREQVLDGKNIFTEDHNKSWRIQKFAIPYVREGSVIEYSYTMDSPFIFTFHDWEFQSDIPKVQSEYWASLPGIYIYNVTLRGFLKLTKHESEIIRGCLGSGSGALGGGFSAECALNKFLMKDIPAFVEEDYMTARANFISAIHFELSEVRHPDGRVDRVTKEWKDAEQELRQHTEFGMQLRKAKELAEEVKKLVAGEADELARAKKVYEYVKGHYLWNDIYGKYTDLGLKKAFDEGKGNVADINLSLVAGLRAAGLDTEPVILSTRANGQVIEIHPVLSEFNYVVAKVNIGGKDYLADATEKYYPFGVLPRRCLNGKGRVMPEKNSYWIDLKPGDAGRTISQLSFRLGEDGVMRGSLVTSFLGYDAIDEREEIFSHPSQDEYVKELKSNFHDGEIKGYEIGNLQDLEKPLSRKLDLEFHPYDQQTASSFLFDPFLVDKYSENPFKSAERLYPVDFAVPFERSSVLTLEYPADLEIENLPEKVRLALPNAGGRFLCEAVVLGNKLSMSSSLAISKTVYSSDEYHYLKELFNRILQTQNVELIFKRKETGSTAGRKP